MGCRWPSGRRPDSYQPRATPWVAWRFVRSQANGLLHLGLWRGWPPGGTRPGLASRRYESRFQRSLSFLGRPTQGVALGWYEAAPLALAPGAQPVLGEW